MRPGGGKRRRQPGPHPTEEGILRQEGMPPLPHRLRIPEEVKGKEKEKEEPRKDRGRTRKDQERPGKNRGKTREEPRKDQGRTERWNRSELWCRNKGASVAPSRSRSERFHRSVPRAPSCSLLLPPAPSCFPILPPIYNPIKDKAYG